jgi:hypothetical protein
MAIDPHYEDGFYDNEDAYFAAEDARAEYRAFRETEELEADDYFDTEDALLESELEEGDWEPITDSERDGYGYFDPNEGCYDDLD